MWGMLVWLVILSAGLAEGLIFRDGPSPAANTETAPTGPFAGSGWELQVNYLNYHGTIISPKHVMTARHLGAAEEVLTRPVVFGAPEEESYAIKGERIVIGETDFAIFEVWETFPVYAELYQGSDEEGRELVIHGSGVGRGDEITGAGWRWGEGSSRKSRWGRNVIKGSLTSDDRDFLYFDFSDVIGQDEVMATGGDSGGGWFIQEGGGWKLAAISSSVDGLYSEDPEPSNGNGFRGAIFDGTGLSYGSDSEGWELIPEDGESNVPGEIEFYRRSHTYGSRISSRLGEIEAVIAPALAWEALDESGRFLNWLADHGVTTETGANDDPDGDGLSNLEEYLGESDPGDRQDAEPLLVFESLPGGAHQFTLRESLDLAGRGLSTVLESSVDLENWDPVENLVEQDKVRDNPKGIRLRTLARPSPGPGPLFYRQKVILGPLP